MTLPTFLQLPPLGGAKIDPELVNIKYISKENYENYKLQLIISGQYGPKIQNPLFVTAQHCIEHEKIENKTKEEISLKIKRFTTYHAR